MVLPVEDRSGREPFDAPHVPSCGTAAGRVVAYCSAVRPARQDNRPTLKSGHIYQITSYATAYAMNEPAGTPVHGVMVYATLGLPAGHSDLSASDFPDVQEFSIGQHRMRFAALDLTGSARKVREAALAAVK